MEMNETQPQTQTQTQNILWTLESQPIENIIWGRLYAKNAKLKSLGIGIRPKVIIENSTRSYGRDFFPLDMWMMIYKKWLEEK